MISKYLNPKNDVAFKRLFGEEKNKDILLAMLNAVLKNQLHKPIKEVDFLKRSQDPEIVSQKQSIVDVLCRDKDGCQYIIEMQISGHEGFEKRAQYYASKAYVRQAQKGEAYTNLKEVIFLAFTNYVVFPKKKGYKSEHVTLDKATLEQDLDAISFTFVELPKFSRSCRKATSAFSLEEKFYYFLDKAPSMGEEELQKLVGRDKVIQRVFDQLERFSWSKEELAGYEAQEKRTRDHNSSLQYAQERGRAQGKKEGEAMGEKKGEEIGKQKGREEGEKIGEKRGLEKGEKIGIEKGEERGIEKGRKEMIEELVKQGVISREKADALLGK